MARDFVINGETLVKVKFAAHVSGNPVRELGLAADEVRILPNFYHTPVNVDDFGPDVPAEVRWNLASVDIRMSLIHYDDDVLQLCLNEAMCGSNDGTLAPAGPGLGRGRLIFASGCHYVSLNLLSPVLGKPWRFRTSYISTPPMEIPLTTKVTIVSVNWRAIPYHPPIGVTSQLVGSGIIHMSGGSFVFNPGEVVQQVTPVEIRSSGLPLWDRELDTFDGEV